MNRELCFQISSIKFKYLFNYEYEVDVNSPIRKFLLNDDICKYDIVNYIYKINSNAFSKFLNETPLLITPAWSKYVINNICYYVFHPNDAGNIAYIKCLGCDFTELETYITDINYSVQPLPLCITGFLLQKKLNYLKKGLIMHGATLNIGGFGIVFTGNSGVGKSTLSKLCIDTLLNIPVKRVTDDRFILNTIDGKLYSYGNPLDLKIDNVNNDNVEIKKIFFLHHGEKNKILKISNSEAYLRLFKISLLPYGDNDGLNKSIEYFSQMVGKIEFYDFYFVPDESAPIYLSNVLC